LTIDYIPDKLCLESKSLKLYLFSYRNIGIFYETAVNRIADDIIKACRPRRLKITGKFNARGGIGISVSVEYP
jgi:7-cyano-7-deazaguanine reductase